jgi:TonB-linked SusC/RagA family outer membrane protein
MRKIYAGWLSKILTLSLIFALLTYFADAQIQVTGQVIMADEDVGLPGVNIIIKGSTQGTITGADGSYSIEVPSTESTLVFSSIGYVTEEVLVGNQTVINITLRPAIIAFDEVVVTGYASQQKRDVTGSVATIAPEDFERMPATTPLEAFQSRVPGLQIVNGGGLPGSGAEVRIRGIQSNSTSNAANSPIYVVDGVIVSNLGGITPADIEHISILKDASEAAIYGARAANGVIVIETKRGKGTGRPEISFNAFLGIQTEGDREIEVLNATDWLELWTEAYENSGTAIPWTPADLAEYEGVNTDWLDIIRQTGVIQSYNLGISGSSEASNYYVSASYLNHKGVVVGTNWEKYTIQFNSDHKIGKRITFGNSLNIRASDRDGSGSNYALAAKKVPLTRNYEDDGSWGRIRNTVLEHQHHNPLWRAQNVVDNQKAKILRGNIYLKLNIIDGLDFTARGNVDWVSNYETNFEPGKPPLSGWEGSFLNAVTKRQEQTLHWITDFLLNYEKTFGTNHNLKVLLGYSLEENIYEELEATGSGTPNNDIRFLNATDPNSRQVPNDGNGTSDWAFISMFGRLNYAFQDKYLVTATVRRDGTSRLSEGNRFGVFPSASLGWRISDESFMGNLAFLSDLKLRASVGTLGNVLALGNYQTVASLAAQNYVLNQSPTQGFSLTRAVNKDIVWESTTKTDIGLDASFFGNQFYTTWDVFIENTQDLLFNENIPESTGLQGSPPINAGKVKNTGFEAILGFQKRVGDWRFDVNFNMTHVKNEVVDIGDRDLRDQGTVEGYPLRSFFGYRSNGLIRTQGDLENNPQMAGKQVGDIWLLDIDGVDEDGNLTGEPDEVVNSSDRTLIGKKYPDLYYGLTGTVGYKNLSLQVLLQGVQGVDRNIVGNYDGIYHYYTRWAMNSSSFVLDRYHPTKNPGGAYPRVDIGDQGNNRYFSEFWLDDASFLRIKNINLSYDLTSLVQGIGMKRLNVYFSIDNLYTFTDFVGPDVDTVEGDESGETGDPNIVVPQPRTFTFGINATF